MITAEWHSQEIKSGFGGNWYLEVSEQTKGDTGLYNTKLIH